MWWAIGIVAYVVFCGLLVALFTGGKRDEAAQARGMKRSDETCESPSKMAS